MMGRNHSNRALPFPNPLGPATSSEVILISIPKNGEELMAGAIDITYSTRGLFHHGRHLRYGFGDKNSMVQTTTYPDRDAGLDASGKYYARQLMNQADLSQVVSDVLSSGSYRTGRQAARAVAQAIATHYGPGWNVHGPYTLVPNGTRRSFRGGDTLQQAKEHLGIQEGREL